MSKSLKFIFCRWCGASGARRFGRDRSGRQRFHCPHCERTFLRRTRTITSGSRLSDRTWQTALRLFATRTGMSAEDVGHVLGVNRKTAQRLNRSFRLLSHRLAPQFLPAVSEWDESVFSKRWVLGGVSRESRQCILRIVPDRTEDTLVPLVLHHSDPEGMIFTDEWGGYIGIPNHMTVCHSREFVNRMAPFVHTNTQEGIWGHAKTLSWHTYRGFKKRSLQQFLAEIMFRYNYPCYATRVAALSALLSRQINTLLV